MELGSCHEELCARSNSLHACDVAPLPVQDVRVKEVPVPMVTDPQVGTPACLPVRPPMRPPACLPAAPQA
jgi:hypothetical protein